MTTGAEEVVFGSLLGPLLGTLPTMLVLLVGLILVAVAGKRLPGKARVLAFLGGTVLLLDLILNVVWGFALPAMIREGVLDYADLRSFSLAYSVLSGLLHAIGIGLLIGALLAARTAPTTATPAMPATPSAGWPGAPVPGTPTPHPTTSAPYPPASVPPAPAQWTPPTS
jgi:hypothetical protein